MATHSSIQVWRINPTDSGAWWATVHRVTNSQSQRVAWQKQLSVHTHAILGSAIQTIQKKKKKGKWGFTKCFRVCCVTEVERYPLRNYQTKTNISDSTAKHSPWVFLKQLWLDIFFPDALDFSKMWSRGSLSDKCRDKACIPRVGSAACAEAWVLVTWKFGHLSWRSAVDCREATETASLWQYVYYRN